jgi:hypothetical protein
LDADAGRRRDPVTFFSKSVPFGNTQSVRVSNRGRFSVRLRCPNDERRCWIHLRVRYRGETIASKRVVVPGGRTVTVRLRLKPFAREAMQRRRRLSVFALTTARDPSGNRATTRTRMTLRAGQSRGSAVARATR